MVLCGFELFPSRSASVPVPRTERPQNAACDRWGSVRVTFVADLLLNFPDRVGRERARTACQRCNQERTDKRGRRLAPAARRKDGPGDLASTYHPAEVHGRVRLAQESSQSWR
jgi:hypothetical protein